MEGWMTGKGRQARRSLAVEQEMPHWCSRDESWGDTFHGVSRRYLCWCIRPQHSLQVYVYDWNVFRVKDESQLNDLILNLFLNTFIKIKVPLPPLLLSLSPLPPRPLCLSRTLSSFHKIAYFLYIKHEIGKNSKLRYFLLFYRLGVYLWDTSVTWASSHLHEACHLQEHQISCSYRTFSSQISPAQKQGRSRSQGLYW